MSEEANPIKGVELFELLGFLTALGLIPAE